LGGDDVEQIGSVGCQIMKEEVRRNLPKTKLPRCYGRLIEFISWLDDPIGGAHADWKEARMDHDRI
jgi:hypothetical protein